MTSFKNKWNIETNVAVLELTCSNEKWRSICNIFNPQNTSNIFSILHEPIAFVFLQAWLTHPIPRRCLSWSTENGFQFDDLVIWHLNCTRNMGILAALPFGQLIFHLMSQPKSKGEKPTSSLPNVKPGIKWKPFPFKFEKFLKPFNFNSYPFRSSLPKVQKLL